MSGGGRLYLAAVDGDRPGPIRPDPVSKYEGILSDRKVVDAACRRYRTAVDGNAAVPPCGDRAAGGIGNDRAAVDGNTAAIPGKAVIAVPLVIASVRTMPPLMVMLPPSLFSEEYPLEATSA